jgi:hypothetical protein
MAKELGMVMAVPSGKGKGLFIILQDALTHNCGNNKRIRLTSPDHAVLHDFQWLTSDLARCPTRMAEPIPASQPATLVALSPMEPFNPRIVGNLITFVNP